MTTPNTNTFTEYRSHGWSLCAIPKGSKGPTSPNWNDRGTELFVPGDNLGLLHALSGTAALDVDDLGAARAWLAERGVGLDELLNAPDAVQIVSGRPGSAKLLFAQLFPMPSRKVIVGGKTVLEFRSASATGSSVQDVLPPSVHPSGSIYRWGGRGDWRRLPALPGPLAAIWESLGHSPAPAPENAPAAAPAPAPVNIAEVKAALAALDPNCSYPEWVEVGMALHSTGHPEAFRLWNSWSSQSTKDKYYPGEAELWKKWGSFKVDGKTTIATLFGHAAKAGWKPAPPDVTGQFGPAGVPGQSSEWSVPQPIVTELSQVLPFDFDMLPAPFAPWVRNVAENKGWPPDYLGVSLMAAAATMVGRKVMLCPDSSDLTWKNVPNLWVLEIGLPSAAKTPSAEIVLEMMRPFVDHAVTLFEAQSKAYESERGFHDAKVKALEAKRNAAFKGDDDTEARKFHDEATRAKEQFAMRKPTLKRYRVGDTTPEALFDTCRENPQGVCFVVDEMGRLLTQMEGDNFATLRGLLLSAYSGNHSHIMDRRSGDRAGIEAKMCLSMLGGIQPGVLPRLIGNSRDGGKDDDGLAQRFGLMVWPDAPRRAAPGKEPAMNPELAQPIHEVLARLDGIPAPSDERSPHLMRFDASAEAAFKLWRAKVILDIDDGITDPLIATFHMKYIKTVCALAQLISMCEGETEWVPMSAWQKAMKWERYLMSHLVRVINSTAGRADVHARNIVAKLGKGELGTRDAVTGRYYVTARELQRKQVPGVKRPDDGRELLEWLEELGYVRSLPPGTIKGVRNPFEVNPAHAP